MIDFFEPRVTEIIGLLFHQRKAIWQSEAHVKVSSMPNTQSDILIIDASPRTYF